RKGVVYVCTISTIAFSFLLAAELLKRLGAYHRDNISILEALLLALALAIAFQPLKNLLHTSLNRYLYREHYDYQRTVREASRRLSTILDPDPLLDYLVGVIEDTFKVEHVSVYLHEHALKRFVRSTPQLSHLALPPGATEISDTSPLVDRLN